MSNIKLTNDIKFVSDSVIGFVDTSNVIASVGQNQTYTCTQDCVACISAWDWNNNNGSASVDGKELVSFRVTDSKSSAKFVIPLRKGTILVTTKSSYRYTEAVIYGLK